MKRIMAIGFILAVLTLMPGCGGGGPSYAETTKTVYDGEVDTYRVLMLGGLSYDLSDMDDPVGQALTAATGVKFTFEFPLGGWNEYLSLLIACGEYPDIICNKDTAITKLVEANALVPLREKMENAPHIKAYIGDQFSRLFYSLDDPEIYGFGSAAQCGEFLPGDYWNVAFTLQADVLIENGYPMVDTLEAYELWMTTYKNAHPTIGGLPTIGLSLLAADQWRWKITITNPAFLVTGKPDDGEWYIDPETLQATFHYKDPREKEYFRWLNHMHDIGLLDPESFTQSYDAYQAKIAQGRVLGVIDARWQYGFAMGEAIDRHGAGKEYIPFPVLQDPETMTWMHDRYDGGVVQGGYMVTTACKDVDKIVGFFDFLASEEGQILKRWGIEGVHYDVVDDERVMKPEYRAMEMGLDPTVDFRKLTGIGKYDDGMLYTPGNGFTTSNGQRLVRVDEQATWDNYSDVKKTLLQAYRIRTLSGLFPLPNEVPESPFGAAWTLPIGQTETTNAILTQVEGLTLKAIAKAVLAPPERFDAEWEAFMAEVERINIGLLEAEVTALLAERMTMWETLR